MSNERVILCGNAEWPSPIQGLKEPLRFQFFGPQQNAILRIQDINKKFITNISAEFIDLMEIASYVYCADQAIPRGGKTDPKMGANWRRHLNFHIPVRRLDIWSSPEILECLSTTLGFLSDDFYTFNFTKLKNPPPFDKYLEGMGGTDLPPEEVVLFSGGLDSLAGAVQEAAIDKKRTILVSHRASPKIHTKQRILKNDLQARLFDCPLPAHVPVWITKHGSWEEEYTQRTRSFLFAALGATMANLFGLNKIRTYENGVVSLNLPISAQLIGARASRTTHPQVLKGFGELFGLILEKPFLVENPFLWKTKSDVVKILGEAGCADLIKYSASCSHVREMTTLHTHCGKCSQCIDRRIAVLAAGYEEYDPSEIYKVDLLTGVRDKPEDKTMIESYVRTATLINKMTEVDFFPHFGEAIRVFSHLEGTADENASRIFDLHKRHASQVCGVIDDAIKNHVQEIREGTLPESCLLILALPEKYRVPTETELEDSKIFQNVFRKKGDFWEIAFNGKRVLPLKDMKGFRYIAFLLQHPHKIFHVLKLVREVDGIPLPVDSEILSKMSEERWSEDGMTISSLSEAGDKARVAVKNCITRSRKKIQQDYPELGMHLHNFIETGFSCSYNPDKPTTWET